MLWCLALNAFLIHPRRPGTQGYDAIGVALELRHTCVQINLIYQQFELYENSR